MNPDGKCEPFSDLDEANEAVHLNMSEALVMAIGLARGLTTNVTTLSQSLTYRPEMDPAEVGNRIVQTAAQLSSLVAQVLSAHLMDEHLPAPSYAERIAAMRAGRPCGHCGGDHSQPDAVPTPLFREESNNEPAPNRGPSDQPAP